MVTLRRRTGGQKSPNDDGWTVEQEGERQQKENNVNPEKKEEMPVDKVGEKMIFSNVSKSEIDETLKEVADGNAAYEQYLFGEEEKTLREQEMIKLADMKQFLSGIQRRVIIVLCLLCATVGHAIHYYPKLTDQRESHVVSIKLI